MREPLDNLIPRAGSGLVNIIIDTPKGNRFFPFDFGSISMTLSEDGDTLDVTNAVRRYKREHKR